MEIENGLPLLKSLVFMPRSSSYIVALSGKA
jgi:hypothetical protein